MIQLDLFLDSNINEYETLLDENEIPNEYRPALLDRLINHRADMLGLTTEEYKKTFLNG